MDEVYTQLAKRLISGQELVIGPLAWTEASKVSGLKANRDSIKITGDGKAIIESLVNQYATLFGKASVEVCREAVRKDLAKLEKDQIPTNLL